MLKKSKMVKNVLVNLALLNSIVDNTISCLIESMFNGIIFLIPLNHKQSESLAIHSYDMNVEVK